MGSQPTDGDLWSRAEGTLAVLGAWWLRRGTWSAAAMASVFIVAKDGISFASGNVANFYLPASQALPTATGYFSSSIGNLVLARLLGIDSVTGWLVLHGVLVALAIGLALVLAGCTDLAPRNVMVLVLLSSSAMNALTGSIGIYDPVTFAGGILLVLGPRPWARGAGVLLLCLGNPEQAIVASVCLLVISLHPLAVQWRRTALMATGFSAVAWAAMQAWLMSSGAGSRVAVLPYLLGRSIETTMSSPPVILWSWLGCGWLIVLVLVTGTAGRARWALVISLLALPGSVTMITVDGARVFGLVVLPAFLVAAGLCWRQFAEQQRVRQVAIGVLIALLILLPASTAGWGWLGEIASRPMVGGADALYRLVVGAG